jgi:DNA polymerase III subunit delta'
MPFSNLIGNERLKLLLRRAANENRIGQSILMTGPRGVGKYQFAIALAQAVNCESPTDGDACGVCLACRKISRNEHLDIRTILRESQDPAIKKDPRSQFIKVDQIRELSQQAQFRPYEGRRRVFIIDDAEWLRTEAANSLLKTLEEPPETSLIILITPKPFVLLDTIRSRCLMLSFAPLSASEIEQELLTRGVTAEEARLRSRLANGSIGHSIEIDLDEYRSARGVLLELLETLAYSRDSIKRLNIAEYVGRKLEKDDFEKHLDALMVLLSDVFRIKLESEALVTNQDVVETLDRIAQRLTFDQITYLTDTIEEIFLGLQRNLNRQLAMDAMLLSA